MGPGNGFAAVEFLSPFGARYGAHSNYFYLAADFGVVGLLVVGACFGTVMVRCLRTTRLQRTLKPFTVGATAGLAALALHSFVDDTLVVFSYRIALLAVMAVAFREQDAAPPVHQGGT